MTQDPTTKMPVDTIRDGSLKATIWKNPPKGGTEKGPVYSVQITRTWRDEQGNYHDSGRFSRSELIRVARLANKAYDRELELRASEPKPDAATA